MLLFMEWKQGLGMPKQTHNNFLKLKHIFTFEASSMRWVKWWVEPCNIRVVEDFKHAKLVMHITINKSHLNKITNDHNNS